MNTQQPDEKDFSAHTAERSAAELVGVMQEITESYQAIKQDNTSSRSWPPATTYTGLIADLRCEASLGCGRRCEDLLSADLNHTGSHKINHCLGEVLLAKKMGKKKVIAETGAGQHGVALATAAALLGLECDIYMGDIDVEKQAPNVRRLQGPRSEGWFL